MPRPPSDSTPAEPQPGDAVAEREPLPLDRALLPSLGESFWAIVAAGCAELGVELTNAQRAAIDAHARLLLAWNRHINLTAIRTEEDVARLHVVDSLTALPLLRRRKDQTSLLDLGSGGGYPGIPLGVALPRSRTALVDSVGKKVRFLDAASAAAMAALEGSGPSTPVLRAVSARAEELAAQPGQRESWDVITARAIGSLAEVMELSLPLLRVGGRVIAWKRRDERDTLGDEIFEATQLIHAAGGARPEILDVRVTSLPGHALVIVRKSGRTPGRFPRQPAERRRP